MKRERTPSGSSPHRRCDACGEVRHKKHIDMEAVDVGGPWEVERRFFFLAVFCAGNERCRTRALKKVEQFMKFGLGREAMDAMVSSSPAAFIRDERPNSPATEPGDRHSSDIDPTGKPQ